MNFWLENRNVDQFSITFYSPKKNFTKSQRPMNAYRNLQIPQISLINPGDLELEAQIINGDSTSIEAIPWQVAIFFHDEKHKKWIFRCGGSILTPKFVMMAGHCLLKTEYPVKPKLYNILGTLH